MRMAGGLNLAAQGSRRDVTGLVVLTQERSFRKGSVARLASYRDGLLLALKSAGTDHWERHLTGDELVHVLDGSTTLEIVCDDGPPSPLSSAPE